MFYAGLLSGINRARAASEESARDVASKQADREQRMLELLASADDPQIKAMAVTGMLSSGQMKKKGGLRGWMGEIEQNPLLPIISQLIQTPVARTTTVQNPSDVFAMPALAPETAPSPVPTGQPSLPAPPPTGAAALPAQSPVEAGAPPMTPPAGPPAMAGAAPARNVITEAPGTTYDVTRMVPRELWVSAEERVHRDTLAKAKADIEGAVAGLQSVGFSPEEARDLLRNKMVRQYASAAPKLVPGELPDGSPTYGVWDPTTRTAVDLEGNDIPGFRPRTTTPSASSGVDRDALSRAEFGKPYARLTQDQQQRVLSLELEFRENRSYAAGRGAGGARIETELGMPLSVTETAAQNVPIGTTMADLKGIVPVTPEQRIRKVAALALVPQIDEMVRLLPLVFPSGTGIGGAAGASLALAQKRAGRDPDFARLQAQLNLAIGNVSRVLAAETGRLTEQDVARAQKALMDLNGWTDTLESAQAKIGIVVGTLTKIKEDIKTPGQILEERKTQGVTPPPTMKTPAKGKGATGPAGLTVVDGVLIGPDGKPWVP